MDAKATLRIDLETHYRLSKLKIEKRFKTMSDTIAYLLDADNVPREKSVPNIRVIK